MYCANKYAVIEAETAITEVPKTLLNSWLSTGDQEVAGTTLATR